MLDDKEKVAAAIRIKEMKEIRWNESRSMKKVELELKNARLNLYAAHNMSNLKDVNDVAKALPPIGQMKFSGSSYGLKTMSITVVIPQDTYKLL